MLRRYWQDRTAIQASIKQQLSKWVALGLNKWTSHAPKNLIGLEIGPDQLKIIEINSTKTPFLVEYFSVSPAPAGAIAKDEIKDHVALGNAIRDMVKQSKLSNPSIALAIPRSIAIIKNIMIDKRLTAEEIESRAWIEANRLFPDLVGDIYLDFMVVENPQDNTQLELILVACRKDQVKPYLEVLRHAGLPAKLIDVNCYALDRALPLTIAQDTSQQTVALLNLNINLSTLIVNHQKQMIYAHDQSFDGNRLLNQIKEYQQNNGLTPDQGNIDEEAYVNILKETLVSHLRHTIHFFYSSRPNMPIQHLIIAGDCASIPGLASFIQREIGIDTTIADPLSHLQLAPDIDQDNFKRCAPSLIQCSGLALSRVDYD